VTTAGARTLVDAISKGTTAKDIAATDLMTGAPLKVTATATAITVALARPVPDKGQGRVRLQKTLVNAKQYAREGDGLVFSVPLALRRASVLLPTGFAVVACNVPSQVLSDERGRIMISFMNQAPGDATLVVKARPMAAVGPAAAPRPLTNARSWEPPGQGPTERARLTERAYQDRDIVYFLKEPSTNAFSLYHDYTESRPGTSTYLNIVRTGSRVSNTSAYILDTGEQLKDETLRGAAITDAKIEIGQPVTPETEVVVVHFAPVQPGQSVRLRISETYTAPQSYRLDGDDLVFERSLGRARSSPMRHSTRPGRKKAGDETIAAAYNGPGHTGGDAIVHFERAHVVHMGDLLFHEIHPRIDRPAGASVENWLKILDKAIKDMPADTIFIAGHARAGEPATVPRAAVVRFRDYFDAVLTLVRKGIASGQAKEAITATPLPGFENYQNLTATINLAAVLGVTYDELTAKSG
jgi:hypothetical protein